jgi:hypothetical protein
MTAGASFFNSLPAGEGGTRRNPQTLAIRREISSAALGTALVGQHPLDHAVGDHRRGNMIVPRPDEIVDSLKASG